MSKNEKRVPELRFKGFIDDWEQRELKRITKKATEKNKNNFYSETLTNSAEFGIITQRDFFEKDISNKKNLRSEEHTSELQSRFDLVCRLLLEKKKYTYMSYDDISVT